MPKLEDIKVVVIAVVYNFLGSIHPSMGQRISSKQFLYQKTLKFEKGFFVGKLFNRLGVFSIAID